MDAVLKPEIKISRLVPDIATSAPLPFPVSEYFEVAFIIDDVAGKIWALGRQVSNLGHEGGVLVVARVNFANVRSKPSGESRPAVHCVGREVPSEVNDCSALFIPNCGFNAWSYPLIIKMLDGVPSDMGTFDQSVFDGVGLKDSWIENPSIGHVPAHTRAEDAIEHCVYSLSS
jgi:hypothetical protein